MNGPMSFGPSDRDLGLDEEAPSSNECVHPWYAIDLRDGVKCMLCNKELERAHETKAESPSCNHTATNGTTLVRANDKITCSVCGVLVHDFSEKSDCNSSASTGGGASPSRPPTSPVECPKCRTQLAFEGDVCGLCQESANAPINS